MLVFWRCILKGFFEKEIRCNYICNKGVLGTWKQEHRELFRDDAWEQHAVNWFGATHPNYIPRCFSLKKSVKKMMLRLPWAIFNLPDCKMYLWKHRSLPLACFFCRNFVSWGFRLPCTARGVECRWYAMCFCYPKFRWVFLLHLCTLHSSRCFGGRGGDCVFCVWNFDESNGAAETQVFQCGEIEIRPMASSPVGAGAQGAVYKTQALLEIERLGTFIEGLKFLKVSPSCVKGVAPSSIPCKKQQGLTHKSELSDVVAWTCFFLSFFVFWSWNLSCESRNFIIF